MTTPGALLRSLRPVKSYTCRQCGKSFQASDVRARYCSNACMQAAKYERNKAKKSSAKPK